MFTGIIESIGKIVRIEKNEENLSFWIETNIISELKIDQSIAHNGICLTIDHIEDPIYRITAIQESILRTNISKWKIGDLINLERCLRINDRLDGHIVQGHVDSTGIIKGIEDKKGSWEYFIEHDESRNHLIIEKGSITLNGISLTCHSLNKNTFKVSIIPYTYAHTNVHLWEPGTIVNIEYDILGKYLARYRYLKI